MELVLAFLALLALAGLACVYGVDSRPLDLERGQSWWPGTAQERGFAVGASRRLHHRHAHHPTALQPRERNTCVGAQVASPATAMAQSGVAANQLPAIRQ